MCEKGFVKANSNNLPKIDMFMVFEFLRSDDRFNAPEIRCAKAALACRESYGDAAIGYVQLKREGDLCNLKCRVCPEHRVRSKTYSTTLVINESTEQIIDIQCHDCAAATDMDQIGEPPRTQRLEGFDLLFGTAEFFGGVLIVLMAVWLTHFRGGFAWSSDPQHEFNWHPLLMTIGLVFLYANGMLIYRSQRNRRKKTLKIVHGGTMIFVIVLTIVALVAVFDSHNLAKPNPIPNMYSLHSWVGLTSVILFCCQWLAGLVSFFYPGIKTPLRASYMPIHVYFGTAGFVGVIASCLLGLNEKGFFLPETAPYSSFSSEGILINVIGLFFIIFGGLVVYIVSQERYKRQGIPEDTDLIPTGGN